MKIYHVETQQAYDELMSELEEKGHRWLSGRKPTFEYYWKSYKENTYIVILGKYINFMPFEQIKKRYQNNPIIEYKAKGEEMKHNLQEVESNLKEAKVFVKKLIEKIDEYLESLKPEFKVGDIVSSEIFVDGSGIVRLEEDLTNDFSGIEGLWYIKKDCEIKDTAFGVINKKTRHATPEEISEYEAALNFHKHGRKPFEVKRGDVVYLKGYDKNIFLDSGNIYKKNTTL